MAPPQDLKLRYDEARLLLRLEQLSWRSRAAFAAACATRLAPAYTQQVTQAGAGDGDVFVALLSTLWSAVESNLFRRFKLDDAVEQCMTLLPDNEDGLPHVEDAVSALAYALRCAATGESQEAAWAARMATDTVDTFLTDDELVSAAGWL